MARLSTGRSDIQSTIVSLCRDPEPFDWYQRFNGIKELLQGHVLPEHRILNVGAGNSRLSEEMFDEGYQNITNIDIAPTCVKAMNEKYKDKGPNFKYLQMDVKAMDFP
jgi:2-polyprenyl-3-methyl-5-hydroxy-6-metoxy-1,4-benzoquinol methylase